MRMFWTALKSMAAMSLAATMVLSTKTQEPLFWVAFSASSVWLIITSLCPDSSATSTRNFGSLPPNKAWHQLEFVGCLKGHASQFFGGNKAIVNEHPGSLGCCRFGNDLRFSHLCDGVTRSSSAIFTWYKISLMCNPPLRIDCSNPI